MFYFMLNVIMCVIVRHVVLFLSLLFVVKNTTCCTLDTGFKSCTVIYKSKNCADTFEVVRTPTVTSVRPHFTFKIQQSSRFGSSTWIVDKNIILPAKAIGENNTKFNNNNNVDYYRIRTEHES